MAAALAQDEKLAIALKNTVIKADLVLVVRAMKRDVEFLKMKAFALLRIAFRFLDLADHAVIHDSLPFRSRGCFRMGRE